MVPQVLDEPIRSSLSQVADLIPGLVADDFGRPEVVDALSETEVLFTCWGCPPLDTQVLAAAPKLRAVVHAAGAVRWHVTEACWERGVVSSAADANALPVAEYTVATMLLANKRVLEVPEDYRRFRGAEKQWRDLYSDVGNYGRIIGVVGASRIGRRVIELLRPYDLEVLVYDPYLPDADATDLGVRRSGLDELCAISNVVSVHAPELPETRHMIDRRRLGLMRDGATLINTARGSLVDQDALTEELVAGRLHAVLDVTEPEILPADSSLYDLPNVLLTPHFAGSFGNEVNRMADSAVAELGRYAAGLPFSHPVLREHLGRTA
ncbi:hydroxyacid dehydrogenase [Streptomyces sp. ID05-18]|uniref:hydroxyacid dehydrogenase n=1 Tax=Streptomyces sp. ID05-18 TaxID=3028662 RepID=UPI0029B3A326|nr:hydroxyacid dehydrogenase [Streptomyces sp. ID05-18]MDX3486609.1 hydroxyacid dehydrogenase [Streptomyces sp. ID05-18]